MENVKDIVKKFSLGRVAQDDLQRIVQVLSESRVKFEVEVKEVPDKDGKRTGLLIIEFRLMLSDALSSELHGELTELVNDIATLSICSTSGTDGMVLPRDLWYLPRDFSA